MATRDEMMNVLRRQGWNDMEFTVMDDEDMAAELGIDIDEPISAVRTYAVIPTGNVEYDKAKAAMDIDEFIAALQEAKEDGATHVVGLSGNYRGAQYVLIGLPKIEEDD